jgi:hypothetical protein
VFSSGVNHAYMLKDEFEAHDIDVGSCDRVRTERTNARQHYWLNSRAGQTALPD